MNNKLTKVYGNPILAVIFGIFLLVGLLVKWGTFKSSDLVPFLCGMILFLKAFVPVCIPYLRYDEKGFDRWFFTRPRKKYKWSDIKKITYSNLMDQIYVLTNDNLRHVLGVNYTMNYREVLPDFIRLIRKNNPHMEIPYKVIKNLKNDD